MIDIAKGRYWDKSWSLVDGCTPCSPGCEHCWSAAMAHRLKRFRSDSGTALDGPGIFTDGPCKFNGLIEPRPDRLDLPSRTRKPTVWAVWNDLFHEDVPDDFIGEAFRVMASIQRHTFLILTKRPQRMLDIARRLEAGSLCSYMDGDESGAEWVNLTFSEVFPNVISGLTVCNRAEADEKIPEFLKVPGKKLLSIEPMLSRMDILKYLIRGECIDMCPEGNDCGDCNPVFASQFFIKQIDAVILGGETGAGARPLHPGWVRSVRDQCAAAGVQFFFKQWGEWILSSEAPRSTGRNKKYQVRSMGDDFMYRVGRKKSGRILDGRTHDELPWR